MNEAKARQRREIRAKRGAMKGDQRREVSALVCGHLLHMPEFSRAQTILAYRAAGSEGDPSHAALSAIARGANVAYPVCEKGVIHAYIPGAWRTGVFGIYEPVPEESEYVAPEALEFVIVPGVAFDAQCRRLGQGKGYYDAYLPGAVNALWVGFALPMQMVESICCEAHDIRLHAIATAEGIVYPETPVGTSGA